MRGSAISPVNAPAETALLDAEAALRVQSSFDALRPDIDRFANVFYARLFERNPNIALLFRADPKTQEARFAAMISTVIDRLDDIGGLEPMLRDLGRRHVEEYGVRPADFDAYGEALCWTVGKFLGDGFTPDIAHAWDAFFWFLSDTMLRR